MNHQKRWQRNAPALMRMTIDLLCEGDKELSLIQTGDGSVLTAMMFGDDWCTLDSQYIGAPQALCSCPYHTDTISTRIACFVLAVLATVILLVK